ncbi:hypothetical protein MMC07_002942 [Pseudocyphellaria aurata]|nr:hypothetical protein [Pseudocyphellaria aurata]
MESAGHRAKRVKTGDRATAEVVSRLSGKKGVCARPRESDIDFSSAPADPSSLSLWVAHQIRRFAVVDGSGSDAGSGHDHPPGRHIREKSDHGVDAATIAEREKTRDGNRKRKQNWRNTHLERNKDNDLRCRINSSAKREFGSEPSDEKAKYVESEFTKRREKRERRASDDVRLPRFTLEANLGARIFSLNGTQGSDETNAVGVLLLNTLEGIHNSGVKNSTREAAAALTSALKDANTNPRPFIEALRTLGATSEVVNAINATLKANSSLPGADFAFIDPNTAQASAAPGSSAANDRVTAPVASQGTRFRGGAGNSTATNLTTQPNSDVIKALEAATNILNDIAGGNSDTYVTPYGNPPTASGRNSSMTSNGVRTQDVGKQALNNTVEPKQTAAGPSLDKSDIDDFLKLAAGGYVSDEEDDAMSDAPDDTGLTPAPQLDGDVGATLQRIINELMTERQGGHNPLYVDDRHGLSIDTSQTDFYGTATARHQATALKRFFAQAGIKINTIIPAAQSHATSQLYAHLSSRANRFPTSGGGINPSHASAYGTTAQMTQRMLARPGQSFQALQPAPSASRGNVVGPPVRARNQEELRKIQDYGFPPLPGSRPGRKRKL